MPSARSFSGMCRAAFYVLRKRYPLSRPLWRRLTLLGTTAFCKPPFKNCSALAATPPLPPGTTTPAAAPNQLVRPDLNQTITVAPAGNAVHRLDANYDTEYDDAEDGSGLDYLGPAFAPLEGLMEMGPRHTALPSDSVLPTPPTPGRHPTHRTQHESQGRSGNVAGGAHNVAAAAAPAGEAAGMARSVYTRPAALPAHAEHDLLAFLATLSRPLITNRSMLSNRELLRAVGVEPRYRRRDPNPSDETMVRITQGSREVPEEKRTPLIDAVYFDMPATITDYDISSVKLVIVIKGVTDRPAPMAMIVTGLAKPDSDVLPRVLHSFHELPAMEEERATGIDVTRLVKQWIARPETNYGLTIMLKELETTRSSCYFVNLPNATDTVPLATLDFYGRLRHPRRRENALSSDLCAADPTPSCDSKNVTFSFDDFGPAFDFVVAPRQFSTLLCSGSCMNYSLPHNGTSLTFRSLCVEDRREWLSVIYMTGLGNYARGGIPDMVVANCACSAPTRTRPACPL